LALVNGFPRIWIKDFLQIHNCVICSSVVIRKDVVDKVGLFINTNYAEDYDYWLRVLNYTNLVYVSDVCFYYDSGHGYGSNLK
jgi:GT2 family glycosyltransferase